LIGYTEMSIRELHDTPGKWRRETKRLNINKDATERHGVSADENGNVQPATLDFSIGEYRPPIRKRQRVSQAKRGLTAAAFFPLLEKARQERKPEQSADEESGMDAKDDPFSPEVLEQRGTESDDLHKQRKGARMESIKEMVSCRNSSLFFTLPPLKGDRTTDGRSAPAPTFPSLRHLVVHDPLCRRHSSREGRRTRQGCREAVQAGFADQGDAQGGTAEHVCARFLERLVYLPDPHDSGAS
jgi:hypothetical protein